MLDQGLGPAPVIVALPAAIDVTCQEQPYDQLYAAFASGAAVVIADFTGTAFCDCSSLRRLAGIRHRAAARGAELRLVIPPGGVVRRVADLTRIGRVVPVYPDVRAAVAVTPARAWHAPGSSGGAAGRAPGMAGITDLVAASHLQIRRWQARLGELRRQLSSLPSGPGLAATWATLAAHMDLHMTAADEVCGPAVYGPSPQGLALLRDAHDAHEDIRELIGEASLQPPGSPLWWRLVTAASAAWTRVREEEEHGPAADYRRRADPALRQRLAWQWRAFREAWIRDRYPDAPLELPTCQLRQEHPIPPRLADVAFSPLSCTCLACTHRLGRLAAPPGYGGQLPVASDLRITV